MASHLRHDAARDVAQVRLVEKGNLGRQDLAVALDVNLVGPVDHDLRDGRVVQEPLDRPVAKDVVAHALGHLGRLGR